MKFFAVLLAWISLCHADEFVRPQTIQELPHFFTLENALQIENPQVVWVNYSLLKKDFPPLQKLSDPQINQWLIENFAYIGSKQKLLDGIRNTPILTHPTKTKLAFRDSQCAVRSAHLEAVHPESLTSMGFVDVKGIGFGEVRHTCYPNAQQQYDEFHNLKNQGLLTQEKLNELRTANHSDGLMALGEALAEVVKQIAVQQLFAMSNLGLETVESYAVIALPFRILKKGDHSEPAALYLRQANLGRASRLFVPDGIFAVSESTSGHQRTESDTAVDFGGEVLIDLRLKETFGNPYTDQGKLADPQQQRVWAEAHKAANRFAQGDWNAGWNFVSFMLAPLQKDYEHYLAHNHRDQWLEQGRSLVDQLRKKGADLGVLYREIKNWKTHQPSYVSYLQALENPPTSLVIQFGILSLVEQVVNPTRQLIQFSASHPDFRVRKFAAQALNRQTDSEAVQILKTLTQDSDDLVQKEALKSWSFLDLPETDPWISGFLASQNVETQIAAVLSLKNRSEETALRKIQELLEKATPDRIVNAAIDVLSEQKGPESLKFLKALFHKSHLKIQVLRALAKRGFYDYLDQFEITPDTVDAFASLLAYVYDPVAVRILAKIYDLGKQDRRYSPYGDIFEIIARGLRKRNDPGSLHLIQRIVKDSNRSTTHFEALNALSERNDPDSLALIQRTWIEKPEFKSVLFNALGTRTDEASWKFLLSLLQSTHQPDRIDAYKAMINRSPQDPELIQRGLSDSNPQIQKIAFEALRKQSDNIDLKSLAELLKIPLSNPNANQRFQLYQLNQKVGEK